MSFSCDLTTRRSGSTYRTNCLVVSHVWHDKYSNVNQLARIPNNLADSSTSNHRTYSIRFDRSLNQTPEKEFPSLKNKHKSSTQVSTPSLASIRNRANRSNLTNHPSLNLKLLESRDPRWRRVRSRRCRIYYLADDEATPGRAVASGFAAAAADDGGNP